MVNSDEIEVAMIAFDEATILIALGFWIPRRRFRIPGPGFLTFVIKT